MRVWVADEGLVVLDERSFVAHGGQGRVWARGQRAYKVQDDPGTVISAGKLAELARITDPFVVRPLAPIEREDRRAAIGHTMRLVENAVPWAQLVPRPTRERLGLDLHRALELVARLRDRVAGLHALGITVVDLHGFNVLVDVRAREPYLIDLDSAQTPSFPATAVAPHILDVEAEPGTFGAATDWFAFAITSFELLCGMHPYRGTHARVHGLHERMRARLSVFSPEVRVPPACASPDRLPLAWRRWLEAVLAHGVREPPPSGSAGRRHAPDRREPAPMRGVLRLPSALAWWTDAHVLVGGVPIGATPPDACGLVAVPGDPRPRVLVHEVGGALVLVDPATGERHPLGVTVGDARVDEGRVLAKSGDRWVEVALHGSGGAPWASLRTLARIAPRASALWPACATQTLLGAVHLYVRTASGVARSIELPELVGMHVLDAAADEDSAFVVAGDGTAQTRVTLRWDADGAITTRTASRAADPREGAYSHGAGAAASNAP